MDVHGQSYEVEVSVTLSFIGSHSLPQRPELHPHRWEVEFRVAGPLDLETGMVCDMLALQRYFQPFVKELDGQNLHQVPSFQSENKFVALAGKYPTCDTLAHYFVWRLAPAFIGEAEFAHLRLSMVKVSIFEPDAIEAWGHAFIHPK